MAKRILIVGGVAGGASCAARLRRLDETAEIVLFERGEYISFANCGLPYYIGGVIPKREQLLRGRNGVAIRFRLKIPNEVHKGIRQRQKDQDIAQRHLSLTGKNPMKISKLPLIKLQRKSKMYILKLYVYSKNNIYVSAIKINSPYL